VNDRDDLRYFSADGPRPPGVVAQRRRLLPPCPAQRNAPRGLERPGKVASARSRVERVRDAPPRRSQPPGRNSGALGVDEVRRAAPVRPSVPGGAAAVVIYFRRVT
jgi:hypothetical protein